MSDPSLSIVVPTLGQAPTLERVVRGLESQQPRPDAVEVFVCVDREGSEPNLPPSSQRSFPITILHAERAGASAARNVGWRAASAPLVLFLDDDVVPAPRLVAEHLAWHDASPSPDVGVLGPVRWSPEVRVTPFMRWLEMGILFDYGRIQGIDAGWEHLYSCNVSIRRDLLQRVGGFDEEHFPFRYEDLDLGRRLLRYGFRLLFNRGAEAHHLKTETLDGWRGKLPRIARSERQFIATYPDQQPYFYDLFRGAAAAPEARGRAARLARFIPPNFPGLGRRVWQSYHMVCLQSLAPDFLAAWDTADGR